MDEPNHMSMENWGKGTTQPPAAFTQQSHDQRVAYLLRRGCRIEVSTPEYTQLVRGKRVNHLLHLILTLCTFGLWFIVWFIVWIVCREDRYIVPRPPAN